MKTKRKTKADWTLADYKKDAWKACSEYVRRLEADPHTELSTCVTCGKTGHWKSMQAGHFVPGRRGLNFFDVRGIHTQCSGCNLFKSGNLIKYWPFMQKTYGQEIIDELLANDEIEKRYTIEELIEIKEDFKKKIELLKNA